MIESPPIYPIIILITISIVLLVTLVIMIRRIIGTTKEKHHYSNISIDILESHIIKFLTEKGMNVTVIDQHKIKAVEKFWSSGGTVFLIELKNNDECIVEMNGEFYTKVKFGDEKHKIYGSRILGFFPRRTARRNKEGLVEYLDSIVSE